MTPEQLQAARDYFLGKSADVSAPGFPRVWTCGRADWTGAECVLMLYDGAGGYRDPVLPRTGWDTGAFAAWWSDLVIALRAEAVDAAEVAALAALDGLEV